MRRRSPHVVLGLPPTAGPEEVRAAFRALARRHHPDSPGGDEARFREVVAAYEELDAGGLPSPAPSPGSAMRDPVLEAATIAQWLLVALMGHRREVVTARVQLTPEEAAAGRDVQVRVGGLARCRQCRGTGHGWLLSCQGCGGRGAVRHEDVVTVRVPPGCEDGDVLQAPYVSGVGGAVLLRVLLAVA